MPNKYCQCTDKRDEHDDRAWQHDARAVRNRLICFRVASLPAEEFYEKMNQAGADKGKKRENKKEDADEQQDKNENEKRAAHAEQRSEKS